MSSNHPEPSSALERLKQRQDASRRVPQPPPKNSAARSHVANDKYMEEWDEAYANLRESGGSSAAAPRIQGKASVASTSRNKWVPPGGGWQDTLPPEAPPPPARQSREVPDELDQLHALSISKSRPEPSSRAAITQKQGVVNRPRVDSFAPGDRLRKYPDTVSPGFLHGPLDPQGILTDISDRPSVCSSADWANGEVVIGSTDHALYGIDVQTGRLRRTLYTKKCGHTEWVTCVTHTLEGKVVSGGMDSRLCLWPANGAVCQAMEGHSGSISQVKLDHSSGMVVSGSYDKTLKVWDVRGSKGRMASSLDGHQAPVLELETGPGGMLLSGDRSGHVILWDLMSGSSSWRLKNIHSGHITSLAWWDGERGEQIDLFMTGGQDGCLRVWDRRARKCLHNLELHVNDRGVGALSDIIPPMAATGQKCITAGADGVVRVLEPRMSFDQLHAIPVTNFVYSCTAAGGLALVGCGDGALHVIDIEEGKIQYALGANQAAVRTIDVGRDRLICSGDDGNVVTYSF